MTSSRGTQTKKAPMSRACHGYGNTHGDQVMGTTGTGTVSDFSTLWHTAYPYCSIMGMIQVNYNKVGLIFTALKLFFSDTLLVFFGKFKVSHCDRTKYGCQVHVHLYFLPSSTHSHSHTASKQCKFWFYSRQQNPYNVLYFQKDISIAHEVNILNP